MKRIFLNSVENGMHSIVSDVSGYNCCPLYLMKDMVFKFKKKD